MVMDSGYFFMRLNHVHLCFDGKFQTGLSRLKPELWNCGKSDFFFFLEVLRKSVIPDRWAAARTDAVRLEIIWCTMEKDPVSLNWSLVAKWKHVKWQMVCWFNPPIKFQFEVEYEREWLFVCLFFSIFFVDWISGT